jgi:phytoene/squalene synthetase
MTAQATVRPTVDAAYEYCEAVTRKAASNFYWGFRLLPRRAPPRA